MADIIITDEDRAEAEAFLEEVLVELIPDADFSPGSVTRDHTISAVGAVVALLRGEARRVRLATSLNTIGQLEDEADQTQAVDNIVANWFLSRKAGTAVRGNVLIHFTQAHDGSIPAGTTFTRTAGVRYILDSDLAYTYQASDLAPRTDATGAVVDYTLRVPVRAENVGTIYEVEAGIFAGFSAFSPYVTFVENENAFTGGKDNETADELLERAPEAISVRDLNSKRSIAAVLQDQFPELDRVVTLGMEDPGMRRDILELLAPDIIIHLGGYIDVFGTSEIVERRVFEGTIGEVFTDVNIEITLFRDDEVTDWRDLGIQPQDVIFHRNADASQPSLYTILAVTKYYLRISPQQGFPDVRPTFERDQEVFTDGSIDGAAESIFSATALFTSDDEGLYVRITTSGVANEGDYLITAVDDVTNEATLLGDLDTEGGATFVVLRDVVEYSIGDVGPTYDNKVTTVTTGKFTRDFQEVGKALLPTEPIYLIREVTILDDTDPDADPITGRVLFPNRVNVKPVDPAGNADDLQYQIVVQNPLEVHSTRQMVTVDLGYDVEDTGANGSFNNSNEFTVANATFTSPDDVGKRIRVLDAVTQTNLGEFEILSVDSPTQVTVDDPDDAGWGSVAEGQLEWELTNEHKYDGQIVRVVYDTMLNHDVIAAYVEDDSRRVTCANTLFRGFHAVYLTIPLSYRLKPNAIRVPSEEEIKIFITTYVNTFPADEVLHASDIVAAIHTQFQDEIDSISLPLVIAFDLYAADGRLIPYSTTDAIRVDANKLTSANPNNRLEDPEVQGIVDDNIRYLTDEDLITLTLVS